jgi:hypothetical protein
MYDGLTNISMFINTFELEVLEQQGMLTLDLLLKATPAKWWDAHKEGIKD